jgi:hypothetical protein
MEERLSIHKTRRIPAQRNDKGEHQRPVKLTLALVAVQQRGNFHQAGSVLDLLRERDLRLLIVLLFNTVIWGVPPNHEHLDTGARDGPQMREILRSPSTNDQSYRKYLIQSSCLPLRLVSYLITLQTCPFRIVSRGDQRSIVHYLHLKELLAQAIHDDHEATLGPKAVVSSTVRRYLSFVRPSSASPKSHIFEWNEIEDIWLIFRVTGDSTPGTGPLRAMIERNNIGAKVPMRTLASQNIGIMSEAFQPLCP